MDLVTFMKLRSMGYSLYLSKLISIAYVKAGIGISERDEILRGKPPKTRNIFTHIISTCVNRHRVIVMPKARLIPRVMARKSLLKQFKELSNQTDNESKRLYRFATQSFGHRDL